MKVLKALFIVICCILSAIIIVFPFWKFATALPTVYSLIILSLSVAALLYLIVIKIRKTPAMNTIAFIVNLILIAASLVLVFILVLAQKRLIALIVLLAFAGAVTLFNILTARKRHE